MQVKQNIFSEYLMLLILALFCLYNTMRMNTRVMKMMNFKITALLLFMLSPVLPLHAQQGNKEQAPPPPQTDSLKAAEMRLKDLSDSMIDGKWQYTRIMAVTRFIPAFVHTLKFIGSYDYPFDSLKFMQKLEPPDKSFKIYSWLLKYDDGTFRYYGAIQMHREDSLKLFPMRDYSERLDSAVQELTLSKDEWYGAFYYDMFPCTIKNRKYYILFGWDGNTSGSNKKIIEALSFDGNGKPVFGAPIFVKDGKTLDRVIFEFAEDATMNLNYLPEQNIIALDHMVPPNPASEGFMFTYVPDGTYDYFIMKGGKWVFQNKDLFENTKKPIKEAGDTPVIDEKKKSKEERRKMKEK
jgi:hypothetical protein